jgi:hypothetical protein
MRAVIRFGGEEPGGGNLAVAGRDGDAEGGHMAAAGERAWDRLACWPALAAGQPGAAFIGTKVAL